MLESIPFRLIFGTALGFLTGMGIGGGSLLTLWLTVIMDRPPETVRIINLLFFLPAAAISLRFRKKQGLLDVRSLLPAIASGCVCAAVFSRVALSADTGYLKRGFGILLILTGLRELFCKKASAAGS